MKSRMHEVNLTIERGDTEIEVTCRVEYTPASFGHRDKYGAPEEPDEPETFEFYDARTPDGTEIELDEDEQARAESEARKEMESALEGRDYERD